MESYYYNGGEYKTLAAAQAAADTMLVNLQTTPSVWCEVKRLQVAGDGSYIVPSETLADEEVLNLPDGVYSVQSTLSGENILGVNTVSAIEAINRLRCEFAIHNDVSTITMVKVEATNADFSAYLGANQ